MWRNFAAQHSQMLEAWFAHLPGVVVVTPATPRYTAGLVVAAIRSDDPVLFFDHQSQSRRPTIGTCRRGGATQVVVRA